MVILYGLRQYVKLFVQHYTSRFVLLATHEILKYFPNSSLSKGSPPLTCILRENADKLEANLTNVQVEQHIPIVTRMSDDIQVSIGSNIHPVLPDHRIEWIAMDTGEKTDIVYLKAGEEPVVEFSNVSAGVVYAYCNIHGLWKVKF